MITRPRYYRPYRLWMYSVLVSVSLSALIVPAVGSQPPSPKHITDLIGKLGSTSYEEREAANRALVEIGQPALDALRHAAKMHEDAEVRRRCQGAIDGIAARQNGEARFYAGPKVSITRMAISPDCRLVLSRDEHIQDSVTPLTRLWELETGKELLSFVAHPKGEGMMVAFSADSRLAVTAGSDDKKASLWDLRTGRNVRLFDGHTSVVYCAVLAPDNRRVLSGSTDRTVRLWDADSGKELRRFEGHTSNVTQVLFSPDGRRALSCSMDKTFRLWDIESGKELHTFNGHEGYVCSIAFSPDGKRALSGGGTGQRVVDHTVRLWDLETGKELARLLGHSSSVLCVAVSPDGKRALSGGSDGTTRLWDLETAKELRCFSARSLSVRCVAFSPDGRRVLVGSGDNTVLTWAVDK